MRRLILSALVFALLAPALAGAQDDAAVRVDVIDVSGPLDEPAIEFISSTIAAAAEIGAEVAVVQLNSPGVVADPDRFDDLVALVESPPLPVAVWVGPAPAVAYGGALELMAAADVRVAAPGARLGLAVPRLVARPESGAAAGVPPGLAASLVEVEGPLPGLVDRVSPSIRQVLEVIDGAVVEGRTRPLETAAATEVVFHKPGFWARFLRLASTPEAAFLFLVAGLSIAAFEFYAIGPGVAAGVAAISLFLAASGLATLPVRWWALAVTVTGWVALTASYQRGSVAAISGLGSLLLLLGGLWFVDGAPQLQMNPAATVAIVAAVIAFYTIAMPTVARARFSTRTIGRGHLVGAEGVAVDDFDPDGEVEVAGARWRAAAHREAGIRRGDPVRITEVDGTVLEVEPFEPAT